MYAEVVFVFIMLLLCWSSTCKWEFLFLYFYYFVLIDMVKFSDLYTNSIEWYQKDTKGKFGNYDRLLMAFTFANISWLIVILLFVDIVMLNVFIYKLGNEFKN